MQPGRAVRCGIRVLGACLVCAWAGTLIAAEGGPAPPPSSPPAPPVSLTPTVAPSALADAARGSVAIAGRVAADDATRVLVRVTTSRGRTSVREVAVQQHEFRCAYPRDFPDAPALDAGALFVDATDDVDFDASRARHYQAEAAVIVYDRRGRKIPDLPHAFTDDLRDRAGHTDQGAAQWPVMRALVNLYQRSRAARLVRVGRSDFDLVNPGDLAWFKNNLTLYEFDYRDRDWSTPLGQRVARTFWQAVWNTWFNASNDHPQDGNPANRSRSNYLPYTFANDFADVLVMTALRQRTAQPLHDNLTGICREATRNLLAMQHRGPDNFALPDAQGQRETYTAGAFRYGLFKNGEFLTEGNGWFSNPKFRDYARGGVFNGRAVWALGEALRQDPQGPLVAEVQGGIALALKFCLHDGAAGGYVKTTRRGLPYWRDAGEHAYLVLGMLAACDVAPNLPVPLAEGARPATLRELCVAALDALVDLGKPEHQWSTYPNVDAMAVAALAEGAALLPAEPAATRWRATATNVADAWMHAKVDPKEWAGPVVHFGLRPAPDRMTYIWSKAGRPQVFYYQTGHWIHALADLYALTGDPRYRARAEAMVSYLCGANPWQVRLFNELGGVYNWTDDTDGDGVQDLLRQDMYPESTAFCQIGLYRLLGAILETDKDR